MSQALSPIEQAYRKRIASLTPAERIARSAAMYQWTRDQIARQIRADEPGILPENLKWQVALRLYGDQPIVREWIERKLKNVSG